MHHVKVKEGQSWIYASSKVKVTQGGRKNIRGKRENDLPRGGGVPEATRATFRNSVKLQPGATSVKVLRSCVTAPRLLRFKPLAAVVNMADL